MPGLIPVCAALHDKNVHIAVETSLFVSEANVSVALEMIDFFFIDVKILSVSRKASIMSTTHQEKHRLSGALRGSGSKWKVEIFSLGT